MPYDAPGTLAARLGAAFPAKAQLELRGLMAVVSDVLKDGQVTQRDYEPIAVYLEQVYDERIAPMDIPYVPNMVVEPMVDRALRLAIRPSLTALFDKYVEGGVPAIQRPATTGAQRPALPFAKESRK